MTTLAQIGKKIVQAAKEGKDLNKINLGKFGTQVSARRSKLAKEVKKGNALLDMRDHIQAGYLGLMTAVDKYDYKRGIRFSTFAYWWIKKAIYESIEAQQNLVRVPQGLRDYIRKYKKTSWQLRNSLGREPSLAELSNSMNLPLAKVEMIDIAAHQEETIYIDGLESLDESDFN